MNRQILHGDALDRLKNIDSDSIDLVCTDPPYFLMNSSGKGFMGNSWDSINIKKSHNIICRSKDFADFAMRFFKSMQVESSTTGDSTVPQNADMQTNMTAKKPSDVPSVKKNSKDTHKNQKMPFVHDLVVTKENLWDCTKELLENRTKEKNDLKNPLNYASYVIPISTLEKILKLTVQGSAFSDIIKSECLGKETRLTLTDGARISGVIEVMTGKILESKYIKETDGDAEFVKNTVKEKRYKLITSFPGEKQKITQWIILSLYVLYVIQKLNKIPTNTDLHYEVMGEFNKSWMTECLRVLKPGAFAFVMSAPRQDVMSRMIVNLQDAGFVTSFTPIFWAYATGFIKASNIGKQIDKKLGEKREVIGKRNNGVGKVSGSGIYELNNLNSKMSKDVEITKPSSSQAKKLNGSYAGFQPKPAVEVILVCMKPLSEKNYTEQAMKRANQENEILDEIKNITEQQFNIKVEWE